VREDGQHRYYRLDPEPFEVLEDWLIPFLSVGFDPFDGEAGTTVFAAWAGDSLRAPLRRVVDVIQNPSDAGVAVGRALADGTHPVKRANALVQDAVAEAGRRLKGGAEKLRSSLEKWKD
jgi:ArsR family transcriptional regulator